MNRHYEIRFDGPDCIFCQDGGLHDKRKEWEFCGCAAGVKLLAEDPEAAKKANQVLARIQGIK